MKTMDNAVIALPKIQPEDYHDKMRKAISGYNEIVVDENNEVKYVWIEDNYFLENDIWHLDHFKGINRFSSQFENLKTQNKTIHFRFSDSGLNLEAKFIAHRNLFDDKWKIISVVNEFNSRLKWLAEFINEKNIKANSFLELDINKIKLEYADFLTQRGVKLIREEYDKKRKKTYVKRTKEIYFLDSLFESLIKFVDNREEWIKDYWDVRNLTSYGIRYVESRTDFYIDFTGIESYHFREILKKYLKERLLSGRNIEWSTALNNSKILIKFLNFVHKIEPGWKTLTQLDRSHILKYRDFIFTLTKSDKSRFSMLSVVDVFLTFLQRRDFEYAPIKSVRNLILPEDKPSGTNKKNQNKIEYIPNYVLEQVLHHFNKLHPEVQPVVLVMLYTGLRISDALTLQFDCYTKVNGKYWLVKDLQKTKTEKHRIPIQNELADMLAVLIDRAKSNSNRITNPKNYIFCRYFGSRKGHPYSQGWVLEHIKSFAFDCQIKDEDGQVFHFKNHKFRHTYAVKLINSGVDLFVVQDLLGHSSPEMTLRYAKFLDNTKRKMFDEAVSKGIFSFNDDGELMQENELGELSDDILKMLWTQQKLTAIDNPYGTCRARINGKCSFSKQPPCLTCNGGKPCKDLEVGLSEMDIPKYEIHIKSTKMLIDTAKKFGRTEVISENEALLTLYNEVYDKIKRGGIVFGNINRIKIKDS